LVVLEGAAIAGSDGLTNELRADGYVIVEGWTVAGGVPPGMLVACVGDVRNSADAAEAVLAVVRGASVVVRAKADRDVIDRLCEDLRHLGPLEHRTGAEPKSPQLDEEGRAIVALLSQGLSLGEAAKRLHISRRTADRRLADVRSALGVRTTAEALVAVRQRERSR
jgi:DNA-binding NarL/FixJ family response regulator